MTIVSRAAGPGQHRCISLEMTVVAGMDRGEAQDRRCSLVCQIYQPMLGSMIGSGPASRDPDHNVAFPKRCEVVPQLRRLFSMIRWVYLGRWSCARE